MDCLAILSFVETVALLHCWGVSFETIVPLFADKVVPSDLTAVQIYELKDFTTASRFLPLGTVVDEAYITEGLESGNLYMQYNIAVDENVDLNDLIEKTDLKTLGINKDIIIEQYSHEDFEGNSWNWLNSFCKPIRTITIKCRLSELLVDMGK